MRGWQDGGVKLEKTMMEDGGWMMAKTCTERGRGGCEEIAETQGAGRCLHTAARRQNACAECGRRGTLASEVGLRSKAAVNRTQSKRFAPADHFEFYGCRRMALTTRSLISTAFHYFSLLFTTFYHYPPVF